MADRTLGARGWRALVAMLAAALALAVPAALAQAATPTSAAAARRGARARGRGRHHAGRRGAARRGGRRRGGRRAADPNAPAHHLKARPANVVFGGFPVDAAPVLRVRSGEVVRIDTISQSGATSPDLDPVQYFGRFGVRPDEVLQDVKDFWKTIPDRPRYGPHVLTGPVFVEGAEPGDTLAIEILDLQTRVPYGLNNTAPDGGVYSPTYPGYRAGDVGLNIPAPDEGNVGGVMPDVRQHLYRTGLIGEAEYAFFNRRISIPMQKHMGVMGLAPATGRFVGLTPDEPPPASGVQSSIPPGPFGGNLDIRDLTIGATLYLPVAQAGGLFYTGDSHGVQGNGEVSGTALEQSLTGTFRFRVIKRPLELPRAEDDEHYIVTGIDWDLDRAMKISVDQMVKMLVAREGLTPAKAYSMASLAGDFQVAEVVDRTQIVTGKIDKALFER